MYTMCSLDLSNYNTCWCLTLTYLCSIFRADVTITDLPDFVELMSTNIDLNKDLIAGSVTAKALTW